MTSTAFFIPDTSPLYEYSPCVGCANGWESAYKSRGDGYDQTFHQASGPGSTVSLNITASSLNFQTYSADGVACNSQYSINGSTWTDACSSANSSTSTSTGPASAAGFTLDDLPGGFHQVSMRAKDGVGVVQFMGVGGELGLISSASRRNLTIDDTSSAFAFSPSSAWMAISSAGMSSSPSMSGSNATLASMYADTSGFYNQTLVVTTAVDAEVTLTFKGETILVYGLSGTNGGVAEVRLDGQLDKILNMSNPWTAYSSLLYVGSGFSENDTHTLTFTNTQAGGQLVIDYALVTTSQTSSSSSSHLVLIISVIAGISALLLIGCVTAYILYTRRHARRAAVLRRGGAVPYAFATGLSSKDYLNGSKASSINDWRQNATPLALGSKSYATSPMTPLSGHAAIRLGLGQRIATANTDRSPPPEYPDYVPYRGPIEPRPSSLPSASSPTTEGSRHHETSLPYSTSTPPLIAGANASASEWLQTRAGAEAKSTSPSPSSTSSSRSERSRPSPLAKPAPLALRQLRDTGRNYDDIALDSYYQRPHSPVMLAYARDSSNGGRSEYVQPQPPSPSSISTPSSLGLSAVATATATRAVGARSVARLWPTRDAVPSTFRTSLDNVNVNSRNASYSRSGSNAISRPTVGQGNSLSPPSNTNGSTLNPYSHPSFSIFDSPKTGHTLGHRSSSASGPCSGPASALGSSPAPGGMLRRGVSIKSVKTIRSFFSGLLFAPGTSATSPVLSTPALPQAAARPDSGIFPLSAQATGLSRGASRRSNRYGDRDRDRGRDGTPISTPLTSLSPSARSGIESGKGSTSGGLGSSGMASSPFGVSSDLQVSTDRSRGHADTHTRDGGGGITTSERRPAGAVSKSKSADSSPNFFIELDPNSPITASRPGSDMTSFFAGGAGGGGSRYTYRSGGEALSSGWATTGGGIGWNADRW